MSKDFNQIAAEALERDRLEHEAERAEEAKLAAGTLKGKGYGQVLAYNQRRIWMRNSKFIAEAAKKYKDSNYYLLMESEWAEEPSEYQQKYHAFMKGLEGVSEKLIRFNNTAIRAHWEVDDHYTEKGNQLKDCITELENYIKQMTELMQYPESDDDAFNLLFTKLNSLYADMTQTSKGNLEVPKTAAQLMEYGGREVIFIDNTVYGMEPDITPDSKLRKQIEAQGGDYYYKSRADEPLFQNVPSMDDVMQGHLGNCYMISVMQAMCAQNPQAIMDAMTDNGDTVTVRFFDTNRNPVFVTVTKKVPVYEINGEVRNLYSSGALWVQMLEKAYAASGLATDYPVGYYAGSYQQIDGGDSRKFAEALFGSNHGKELDASERFFTPESYNRTGDYTQKEEELFNRIAKCIDDGKAVMGHSKNDFGEIDDRSGEIVKGKTFGGIVGNHAYTITGAYRENGKCYIMLRNPHARLGRNIDENGNPVEDKNAHGVSKMELRSFCKFFSDIRATEFKLSAVQRDKLPEGKDLVRRFGGAVNSINRLLRETADRTLDPLWSTREFNRFKTASIKAAAAMNADNPDPEAIKKSLEELFLKAEDYESRKKTMKDFAGDFGKQPRLRQRVKCAEMIALLQQDYRADDPVKEVSFAEYFEKAGAAVDDIDRQFNVQPDMNNVQIRNEKAADRALAAADKALSDDRRAIKNLLDAFDRGDEYADFGGALGRSIAMSMVHKALSMKLKQDPAKTDEEKAAEFERQLNDMGEVRQLENSEAFKSYLQTLNRDDIEELALDEEGIYIQRDFDKLVSAAREVEKKGREAKIEAAMEGPQEHAAENPGEREAENPQEPVKENPQNDIVLE